LGGSNSAACGKIPEVQSKNFLCIVLKCVSLAKKFVQDRQHRVTAQVKLLYHLP
jgi:hypothetical protein